MILASILAIPLAAATKLIVTVTDRKAGTAITGLQASDFTITVDNNPKQVQECEYVTGVIDIVLMVESSSLGQQAASLAPSLIAELSEKEQMSIVAYDASAEQLQDFTSSKDLLREAIGQIRFGNSPRLLDALYAVVADGFEGSTFRRVILLLTSGVDGPNSVTDEELLRICRRNGVSIFPVHLMGYGRSKLRDLARLTGGALFSAQDLSKHSDNPAAVIFEAMRGHYRITIGGNLPLGEKAKFEIRGHKTNKLNISFLELN